MRREAARVVSRSGFPTWWRRPRLWHWRWRSPPSALRAVLQHCMHQLPLHRCDRVRAQGLPLDVPGHRDGTSVRRAGRLRQLFATAHARLYGRVGLAFAAISATALVLDYAVQLAVMQPSLLAEQTGDVSLFSQYNPHGGFIALEDAGYFTMGVALFFAASALDKGTRPLRAGRVVQGLSAVLAVGSLVLLAAFNGRDLDYRYEPAAIVIDWAVVIVSGVLLSGAWRPAKTLRERSKIM